MAFELTTAEFKPQPLLNTLLQNDCVNTFHFQTNNPFKLCPGGQLLLSPLKSDRRTEYRAEHNCYKLVSGIEYP